MTSNIMSKPSSLVLLFLMTLIGCTSASTSVETKTQLSSHIWALQQLNGTTAPKGDSGKPAFILFNAEEGKISGNTGCNNFFGTFTSEGNTLSVSPLGMTRMFCSKSADLESAFSKMLADVASYIIADDQLSLLNAEGVIVAVLKK